MTIDSVEFSMLLEGYADSRQPECQALRKELVEHIDAHCEQQVAMYQGISRENGLMALVLNDTQIDLRHAREAYVKLEAYCLRLMDKLAAQPPSYIGMSQAGLGADAHGYVRGWNDCVDAVTNRGNM